MKCQLAFFIGLRLSATECTQMVGYTALPISEGQLHLFAQRDSSSPHAGRGLSRSAQYLAALLVLPSLLVISIFLLLHRLNMVRLAPKLRMQAFHHVSLSWS